MSSTSARAQTEVGELTGTRAILAPGECPELANAPPATMINIRRGGSRMAANPPAKLFVADVVSKPSAVVARVRVDAADLGSGVLYLVPTVECYPGIRSNMRITGALPLGQSSEYEIASRAVTVRNQREQRLAVAIHRGALVVQWNRGAPLLVLAASDTITITGTTVAFSVDSTGNQALVYVREGTITVSRLAGGTVGPGELVRLQRGQLPTRAPAGSAARTLDSAVDYFSDTAWSLRNVPDMHIGFKAGSTSARIEGVEEGDGLVAERLKEIGGGAFLRFGGGALALQTELVFATRGVAYNDGGSLKLSYIEVPVLLRVDLGRGASFAPYLMLGPTVAFETGCSFKLVDFDVELDAECDDPQFDFETKSTDIGGTGVFGLELRLGPGSAFVEGRYTHGFTNIRPDGVSAYRNRTYALMAGYAIALRLR